ncbi:MAG: rod shape-determining protein MreC [Thiobacillaceae bacterium]|nr:rod shape-determining protein MreC [Thiobacillaceae bacterium]
MSPAPHAPLFVREMGLPARFGLYVLICLFLLALDARYSALSGVRAGLNAMLHPLQMGLAQPWAWLQGAAGFFVTHGDLAAENARLRQQQERLRAGIQDRQALSAENARLRALLAQPPRPGVTPVVGEIMETMPDPFSRKVVINRGAAHGLSAGWPVVDAVGLVGQVTRVYPWTAEVTLLTDRDQGAPVQNLRNGLRIIVSGQGSDTLLEVRFLDMHADLQPGDLLHTSGIDGVYPAGIPVAQVVRVEPPRHTPFARALCRPLGGVGQYRHMAVLKPDPVAPGATVAKPGDPARDPSVKPHAPR